MKEFAIIQTGGKQYLVEEGLTLKIEKIKGDHKVGDSVVFDNVLLVDNGSDTTIGAPFIAGAKVSGEIKKIDKAKKDVKMKGYVPGTLITKANKAKEKRLTKRDVAIRGLI